MGLHKINERIKNNSLSFFEQIKNKGNSLYKKYNRKLGLVPLHSYSIQNMKQSVLVGTKNGLYLIRKGDIFRVRYGQFYGITIFQDFIFVFERIDDEGRIIKFNINFEPHDRFEIVTSDLSPGCHQIDFISDRLYVTDTYNNRILIYNYNGIKLDEFYPLGILENGRDSINYGHINSVFSYNNHIYLLCHNETKKTEKKSELLKLNKDHQILDKIKLNASSAHNCLFLNDQYLVCDSLNSRLILGQQEVFENDLFTRGLAAFDDLIVVGGSEYAQRGERKQANGKLFILDRQFNLLEEIDMPAMVQEIRGVNEQDYSLSNVR